MLKGLSLRFLLSDAAFLHRTRTALSNEVNDNTPPGGLPRQRAARCEGTGGPYLEVQVSEYFGHPMSSFKD